MFLTEEMLLRAEACEAGLYRFSARYPSGIWIADKEDLAIVLRSGLGCYLNWFHGRFRESIGHLLTADKKGFDLSGVDLSNANLERTVFDFADLSGANLAKADVFDASFYCTNLQNANLTDINLDQARWAGYAKR